MARAKAPAGLNKLLARRNEKRRARRPIEDAWRGALAGEVRWWGGRIEQWPEGFAKRCDPALPLQDDVAALIDAPPGTPIRILDAGAGPVTYLGKVHDSYPLEITAVDALADEYNRVLTENDVEPPVRTQQCETERLSELLPENHFDVGYARNTLDHSYDPTRAVAEMLHCLKPGAPMLLRHAQNVAEKEKYLGLHQWNLCVDDGHFFVWRPGTRTDVGEVLAGVGVVEAAVPGDPGNKHAMHSVVIRKNR